MIDRFRRQSRVELGLDATALVDTAPTADQHASRRQRIDRVRSLCRATMALADISEIAPGLFLGSAKAGIRLRFGASQGFLSLSIRVPPAIKASGRVS